MGFAADVDKAIDKKLRVPMGQWQRGVCFALFKGVIMDTPRDEGGLVANWYITKGTPSSKYLPNATATNGGKVGGLSQEINGIINGEKDFTMYMANNAPYAHKIEYGGYPDGPKTIGGSSTKAPQGMLRRNVARIDSISRANK